MGSDNLFANFLQLPAFRFAGPAAKLFAVSVELPDSSNRTFLVESPGTRPQSTVGQLFQDACLQPKEQWNTRPLLEVILAGFVRNWFT